MLSHTSIIAVLGHFADGSDRLDGQILRTRITREELCKRLGAERVVWADTGYLSKKPLRTFFHLIKTLSLSKTLVVMPGIRGLKVLMPLYTTWKKISRGHIHFLVIGGWLPECARTTPRILKHLRQCDGIYVQTSRMANELHKQGLSNIHLLSNYRNFPLDRPVSHGLGKPLRLVFLSRITEAKGLDLAVDAVREINFGLSDPKVLLTIYGQVQNGQENWFAKLQERFTPEIMYAGGLRPDEINDYLIQHDVMLFPTWYSGEGFPGVLIDAMIAGIPVIASDWRDNRELILEGETGLLCNAKDLEDLILKIRQLADDLTLLRHLKSVSAEKASKYHTDQIWPQLLQELSL